MAGLFAAGDAALQEAHEIHPGADAGRHFQPDQRIVEFRRPIDPDRVVELVDLAHHVLALPFGVQQMRRVHHVAQPQHQPGAAGLQIGQRLFHLAVQAHRLLVDDEHVGLKGLRGMQDDRLPHLQRLVQVDMPLQRGIFAVPQLDDAGDLHEIDARAIVEGPGDGGARHDQHVQPAVILDQRMGDGAAASQMPQTEGVMAVHEDAGIFEAA